MEKTIHVYSHTHWDYEWYFTSSESIVQLIYHMDEVITALESGALKYYLLDSQTSILEEYLSYMPQRETVVKRLVQEGKLLAGPWYTQSDELIISGESLMRNLWYGMAFAKKLGRCMMIGYLPDSFGQSQDMPKIYHGFHIYDCLFWRGVPDALCKQREFYWQSSDGSRVLSYNIRDGYYYGGNLIYTDDVPKVEERFLKGAQARVQLLPVGGDQRYVDFDLKERMAYYEENSAYGLSYQESSLPEFFAELRKEKGLPVVEGEFIDASVSKIHHSIYSSRYDHKRLNDAVERRLLYQLEPFMAMQQSIGIPAKTSVLEKLWKKVLLNHAHDSACGCNSDQTNSSISQRLQECEQFSSMLLDYQVRKLSESMEGKKENQVYIYNTLPYTRSHLLRLTVTTKKRGFRIVDENGAEVAYDLLEQQRQYAGSIRKDTSLYEADKFYYESSIVLKQTVPPTSMIVLQIMEEEAAAVRKRGSEAKIENDRYLLVLEQGRLRLRDKQEALWYEDLLSIEDGGDDGDTYDYSPPQTDAVYHLDFSDADVQVFAGRQYQEMRLCGYWKLPEELETRALGKRERKQPYELVIMLEQEGLISFHLRIDNRVRDHRMRVLLHTGIHSRESLADTLFGIAKREHAPSVLENWRELGYKEEPTPIYPLIHHVSIAAERSATLYAKGIKEYQTYENGDMALTLFRGVGQLGKPDLYRRPGIASGNEFRYIETPLSQLCLPLEFDFAFSLDPCFDLSQIRKRWFFYAVDMLSYQIQEINRFVNVQKYFVTHPYQQKLPRLTTLLDMDACTDGVISALYPTEDMECALRIWNTADRLSKEECFSMQAEEGWSCAHDLSDAHVLTHPQRVESVSMKPYAIKTYKFRLK